MATRPAASNTSGAAIVLVGAMTSLREPWSVREQRRRADAIANGSAGALRRRTLSVL
jgi:hypothetical protein